MLYEPYNNMPGRSGLVDEIRRVTKGLYLGAATQPTPEGGRTEANGCFILMGPSNSFVGVDDPERERL